VAQALNIFLIEDDELDVMNVQRAFRNSDKVSSIHVAGDGVDALEMLRQRDIPLGRLVVLLDVNMPRMNGIELLRELRADPELRFLPVVMLTTSNDERDKIDAYALNVAGYILKPVTFERFVECMKVIKLYWTMVEFP
jgi:CheY-like chemotaxis protein